MNRVHKSMMAVSMAGASLVGCSTPENTQQIPQSTTQASISPETQSDPLACTAAERLTIEQHIESGDPFTAEVLAPTNEQASALTLHNYGGEGSAAIINPLVLRCGGAIVGYAGRTSNDNLRVLKAQDVEFQELNRNGSSGNSQLHNTPEAVGGFAMRELTALPTSERIAQNGREVLLILKHTGFTDGQRNFGIA